MFAGHGTLRRLSGAGYKEKPTKDELATMQDMLQKALEAGAYGMTTGLEYTPGTYAGEEELLSLARTVGAANGLIMSHIRNEDDEAIEASLRELLRQGQYCHVHASHLKVVYGKGEARAEEILSLLDSARRAGNYRVTADVYPYNASYTGIGIVFPDWAKAPNDYATVRRERRAELLAYLKARVMKRNGPEATLFGTSPFAGKTLQELSEERGQSFEEVLMEIGPGDASGAYFVMDEPLQARLLADPHVMVSSDGSPTMHHPRGYGSFAKIIEQYVNRYELFPLHEAVRKMSSLTAHTIGITDRGAVEAGKKADLLIFDPGAVRAHADFTDPHQLAEGFDYVIVNGRPAVDGGTFSQERFGKVLRKR
jgi:N-acyl-D-amino-acid deacylase